MDTIIYMTLGAACAFTIFYFGWLFGCWMVQRDEIKQTRDCYTNDFYTDYYSTKCCKDEHHHKPKKKGKKVSKK